MEKEKLSYTLETVRFGMAEIGSSLTATIGITFFAIFVTEMAGLSAAAMGAIISFAGLVDTASVPFIGIMLQKSRFKSGKFRPFILWGGLIAAVFTVLRLTDFGLEGTTQFVYFFVTYAVCQIGLNTIQSGWTGVLPVIAKSPEKRIMYTSCAIQFNSLAKFLHGLTAVSLIAFFSRNGGENTASGYTWFAVLAAVIIFASFYQCYTLLKPIDLPEVKSEKTGKKSASDVSILEMLKSVASLPMMFFLIAGILKISTFFVINGLAPFYYQYVIGDRSMLTVFLSVSTLLMFGGATLTPFIAKRVGGARNAYITGALIYGLAMLSSFLFKGSALGITSLICIGYVGYAFMHSSEKAVYSTIADYTEYKTGKDMKGFLMSIILFCPKIGNIIQGIVLGIGLTAIGFDPNNVTPEAIEKFPMLMSLLPAIMLGITALSMFLFPLTNKRVEQMQAELKARGEMASKTI
jgi:GPH family glycoside/pentoside/hexuronide:cation symporter